MDVGWFGFGRFKAKPINFSIVRNQAKLTGTMSSHFIVVFEFQKELVGERHAARLINSIQLNLCEASWQMRFNSFEWTLSAVINVKGLQKRRHM